MASAVVSTVGNLFGVNSQKKAATQASNAQIQAAQMGIDEQRRQFDLIQQNVKPYLAAGNLGLQGQQDILGLNGNPAQVAAIQNIMGSGLFNELNTQGQNALLQTQAATGGLRGGNTQAALAQFSPNLLNQLIASRYANLGGFSSIGQNAATLSANAGQNMANNVSSLFGQQGSANAGAALARGKANTDILNNLTGTIVQGLGMGGF